MTEPDPPDDGEAHYREPLRQLKAQGIEALGITTAWAYYDDPKRLAFTFARYKFVAKMLAGCSHVLEVGCGDAFATRIVRQDVPQVTAVDFDQSFIDDAVARRSERWPIEYRRHNVLAGPVPGTFDGMFSLDVLEHVKAEDEGRFIANMIESLTPHGTLVIGTPSLQSQDHASPQSKKGHVNCKDQRDLRALMLRYFHNVYMFSMNDEVVHTGFHAMSHYNLALCCGKRDALP